MIRYKSKDRGTWTPRLKRTPPPPTKKIPTSFLIVITQIIQAILFQLSMPIPHHPSLYLLY